MVATGPRPRDRFDAPHSRRHAAFETDGEETDVARRAAMGSSAQLHAEARNRHHAHAVAVLFAEQRHRAGRHGFLRGSLLGDDRAVAIDLFVDDPLDLEICSR